MFKSFALLLLMSLFSTGAFASPVEYNLFVQDKVQLPDSAMSAYVLEGTVVKVEMEQNFPVVTALRAGHGIVQVLQSNGVVKNIIFNISRKVTERSYVSHNLGESYKGHSVFFRSYYTDSFANGMSTANSNYGFNLNLNTATGTHGHFMGRMQYNENYYPQFYAKQKYKIVYAAYGDDPLMMNEFYPNFIQRPLLRQAQVGLDTDSFDMDFWTGAPSKTGLRSSIVPNLTSNINGTQYWSPMDNQVFGGLTKFYFGENNRHAIFASYWKNPEALNDGIPYVGSRFNFFSNQLTIRTTIGGDNERPVWGYSVAYNDHKLQSFTLKEVLLTHFVAPKGYDSVYTFTQQPKEDLTIQAKIHGPGKGTKEGTVFIEPRYGYGLDSVFRTNSYGGVGGYQNAYFRGYVEYGHSTTDRLDVQNFEQVTRRLRPGLTLWLTPEKEPVRYKMGLYQNFVFNKSTGSVETNAQESAMEFYRVTAPLDLGIKLSRISSGNDARNVQGYSVGPSITYRRNKFFANAAASFVYNNSLDQANTELNNSRASARVGYQVSNNLSLEGRYTQGLFKTTLNRELESSAYMVSLTWKSGDRSKPITSIFDGSPIVGQIYEDKNFNEKFDKDEKAFAGVIVSVSRGGNMIKQVTTNADGEFSFKGLDFGTYRLSFNLEAVKNSNFTFPNLPNEVTVKENHQNDYNLFGYEGRKVSVNFAKSKNLPESINLRQTCSLSGIKVFALPSEGSDVWMPAKDDCQLEVDLESPALSGFTIKQNKLSVDKTNKISFSLNKLDTKILGLVFLDKNENNVLDEGEELPGSQIFLSGKKVVADSVGEFALSTSQLSGSEVTVTKVITKGNYKCQTTPSRLSLVVENDKSFKIRCQAK